MSEATPVHPFKLASILLQYPTRELLAGTSALARAAAAVRPRRIARELGALVTWLRATEPTRAAQHYVETFDLTRRCALYLTYYGAGDTRRRGMSMLAFKAAYRDDGLTPTDDELPDFLPMVLDFAAVSARGERLLIDHRAELELLRRGLHEATSPYAGVLDAVCSLLPALQRRELARVKLLWESGPPGEDVGLEPFAPPDYLRTPYPEGRPAAAGPAAAGEPGERR